MGWFSSGDDDNNGLNTAFPRDTNGDFGREDVDDDPAVEQGNDGNDSGDSGNQ